MTSTSNIKLHQAIERIVLSWVSLCYHILFCLASVRLPSSVSASRRKIIQKRKGNRRFGTANSSVSFASECPLAELEMQKMQYNTLFKAVMSSVCSAIRLHIYKDGRKTEDSALLIHQSGLLRFGVYLGRTGNGRDTEDSALPIHRFCFPRVLIILTDFLSAIELTNPKPIHWNELSSYTSNIQRRWWNSQLSVYISLASVALLPLPLQAQVCLQASPLCLWCLHSYPHTLEWPPVNNSPRLVLEDAVIQQVKVIPLF